MILNVSGQLISFIMCIFLGVILSIIYDVFRALRKIHKHSTLIICTEDLIFWIIAIISSCYLIFGTYSGNFRFFMILGLAFGAFFYLLTFSKYIKKLLIISINVIEKIIATAFKIIIFPFVLACKIVKIPVLFIFRKLKSILIFVLKKSNTQRNRVNNKVKRKLAKKLKRNKKALDKSDKSEKNPEIENSSNSSARSRTTVV